jgi:hypothetical protein
MEILALRLVHIAAGAFWVGSVFSFFLFVQPAALAVGPEGAKFSYELLHRRRFSVAILGAAAITVVAGSLLLALTSNGLDPARLFDTSRLGYTVGGVAAILTFAIGGLYIYPRTLTVERTLGRLLADRRGPTADEQVILARTGVESRRAGWVVLIGLTVAVVSMATARLWGLYL